MKPADAAELLTLAAAFDRRTVGKTDATAWADALRGLDIRDCAEAIRAHFRESTDYLMPAHVRQGVKRIRAERIRTANSAILEPHDVDPIDARAYNAAKRARIDAIAGGRPVSIEPIPITTQDVKKLLEETVAALPEMPPALPEADLEKKRAGWAS